MVEGTASARKTGSEGGEERGTRKERHEGNELKRGRGVQVEGEIKKKTTGGGWGVGGYCNLVVAEARSECDDPPQFTATKNVALLLLLNTSAILTTLPPGNHPSNNATKTPRATELQSRIE